MVPPPHTAVPQIKKVFDIFPPDFPPYLLGKASIPFIKGGAKGQEKFKTACLSFIEDYESGLYHSDPNLVLHILRKDGKVKSALGTNSQESKHRHEQQALCATHHSLRSGTCGCLPAPHIHHIFL